MSTTARLFIDDLPEVGDGVKRYVVDCKWGTTTLLYVQGSDFNLPEQHRISVVLQRHEDGCGRCNLGRLWREHGDLELKAAVDRTWQQLGAVAMRERRN